ncbi:hypothetical protein J6590_040725 [Homalodisca vitripennis]|nr:hypothetical protein J6590_040725 [Homalodisca vitripennis]
MAELQGQKVGVHWFRHGLRFHDNPALLELLQSCQVFVPIFIFDGFTGFSGAKTVSYNRIRFLLECLLDLNNQLAARGGRLYVCAGDPPKVLHKLKEELGQFKLSFDEDYEPIWHQRDLAVRQWCQNEGIEFIERGSHTLWDPRTVIQTNGGVPPLTYQMFVHTMKVLGPPPRPVSDIDWSCVSFGKLENFGSDNIKLFPGIPAAEELGISQESGLGERVVVWEGGENRALRQLQDRVIVEAEAFKRGLYLPNQAQPDLLAPPTSLSAALSAGCLSGNDIHRYETTARERFQEPNNIEQQHLNASLLKLGSNSLTFSLKH